jgi:di/tricarboxylate transporter
MIMAGSADFLTPVGYQTNMIVYEMANHRFLDFTIFGLPLLVISSLLGSGLCVLFYE